MADEPRERRIDRPIIDLDRVAAIIIDRVQLWVLLYGLVVDPLTWTAMDADWPYPILTDRSRVRVPKSVGAQIHAA